MDDRRIATLQFLGSQLVFLAGLIHVGIGAREWLTYASVGIIVPPDIRWPLFVISGLAVIAGIGLARRAERKRPWYLLGVVVMLGYVGVYFLWHLGGHRPLFVLGTASTHDITLDLLVDHYFAGPAETFTLTVELLAAALLGILFLVDEE